jgi:hypothetical protein
MQCKKNTFYWLKNDRLYYAVWIWYRLDRHSTLIFVNILRRLTHCTDTVHGDEKLFEIFLITPELET